MHRAMPWLNVRSWFGVLGVPMQTPIWMVVLVFFFPPKMWEREFKEKILF